MKSVRLRHIILFILMAVFVTPIRAGISTDYLLGGALTLKNGRIDKYYFEGGFARAFETSATTDRFVFYYYNQDHLGNNREVVDIKGRIYQVTNYYPLGAPYADENAIKGENLQPYKYNGKELDLMHGLNTYDYGARQYDPILARWDRVDPLCEKDYPTSPYVFCGNNPVNRIDKDGRIWDTVLDLAFVAYDAAEAAYQYCTTGHVSNTTKAALGADALAAAVPCLTGTGLAVRTGAKAAENAIRTSKIAESTNKIVEFGGKTPKGRAGITIAKKNGITIETHGTNDVHKPAHAHVTGKGEHVRIGANGKPLKGQPELSPQQKRIVVSNKSAIRREVNKIGKENKKMEDYEKSRGNNR